MIAIDTSVVVRLLTRDDEAMALRARRLMETEVVFVAATVVLEADWGPPKQIQVRPADSAEALGKFLPW
jgi:uncharacterized protein with PIN domain